MENKTTPKEDLSYARFSLPDEAKAFDEKHKGKIGKDYRLEMLKLSKEDIYDFLDNLHQDNAFEWMKALGASRRAETFYIEKLDKIQKTLECLRLEAIDLSKQNCSFSPRLELYVKTTNQVLKDYFKTK